ncbi:cytochrome P450 [Streptomyces sp. NBC_01530]|uniref:cytochrome P450 n=1 Tax=Streptomyces sp. NBC_01530 TaxID=2903895 RepID=UPI0038702F72
MTFVPALVPVPGPRGLPVLGNLIPFGRDPLAFLERLRDDFGDAVTWSLGPIRALLLSHPDHIAELLASDHRQYGILDAGWAFKRLVGDSVIRSEGPDWRRKRSLVQPVVRPRQVRKHAAAMVECAQLLAGRWRDGDRIDVGREMALLTQRIVGRTLFGEDPGDPARALCDAMAAAGRELGAELRGIGVLLPAWMRTPGRNRLLAAVATIDTEMTRLIRLRLQSGTSAAQGDDLLSQLLAARDEQGRPLSAKEVRDEAVTLWVGGHETTATTLTWAWSLLSTSSDARSRLTSELDQVLAGRAPAMEDYEQLVWTQQVVKEALRLYPPGWMIPPRVARESATIAGRPLAPGTTVWCSQWSTHRDARWFPDPTAFRPERWDPGTTTDTTDRAWFPFGGGPRSCLGARYGFVQTVLVLATLAQRFHLDCAPPTPTPAIGLLLQPSESLYATLRARSPHA